MLQNGTVISLGNNANESSNLINYLLYSTNTKQIQPKSTKLSSNDLYKNGLKYKANIKEKSKLQKTKIEQEKMKECTFHPKTTFYKIKPKAYSRKKTKDVLLQNNEVSVNMDKIMKKPFREIRTYADTLYRYHSKYKLHIEVLSKTFEKSTCPFSPQIKDIPSKRIQVPFLQRMIEWDNIQKEKKKDLLEKEYYDQQTGRRYFEPFTLRYNTDGNEDDGNNNRNHYPHQNNQSVLIKGPNKKQEANNINNERIIKLSNTKFINKKSEAILSASFQKIYRKIFAKICNKQDIISKDNLSLDRLSNQIKDFINPLTEELVDSNETLNEEEFITACHYLTKQLNVNERNKLLQCKVI